LPSPTAAPIHQQTAPPPHLLTHEVAARYRRSVRSIRELTRNDRIPHFKTPGSSRCLFRIDQLEQWETGAPLEVIVLRGAKIVRPLVGHRHVAGEVTEPARPSSIESPDTAAVVTPDPPWQ
jgi:hypothetical protein